METAKEYLDTLRWCMGEQKEELGRLIELQNSYDNRINPDVWPTDSQIPTAQHFVAVEEALGPAMDMCFPESNGLQLIPEDVEVAGEQVQASEWALWTMINYKMQLRTTALRSLKDCFKCGVGYGIVEPFTFTPDTEAIVHTGGKKTRIMVQGKPQTSIRYRYISPTRIVPYPEGTDFDGPDAAPMVFFYDPHPMHEIEALYEGNGPIEKEEMLSSLARVKELSSTFLQSGVTDFVSYWQKFSGRRAVTRGIGQPETAPVKVPIIKVYEQPGTVTWIVPSGNGEGEIILRRESDGVNKLRSGLVKWSAWPDGDRWFPMSQPEADRVRSLAYDQWLNFFFDMMSRTKDARLVVNKSALDPEQRRLDDTGPIFTQGGPARDAAAYLESPRIDPSLPQVGDVLDRLGAKIRGTQDFMQKNYTRGGTGAFNDLLNQMQARQRLSALILETGALTQVYEHVLGYMQQLVPETGYTLTRPVYDQDQRRTLLERKTITSEDLRHGYAVVLDTGERRMLGGMADQERLNIWTTLIDREDVVKSEVNRIFPLPDTILRRVFKKPEQLDEMQAQDREIDLLGQLGGMDAGAGAEPPPEEAGPPGMEGLI
jgi:hypothetical protein